MVLALVIISLCLPMLFSSLPPFVHLESALFQNYITQKQAYQMIQEALYELGKGAKIDSVSSADLQVEEVEQGKNQTSLIKFTCHGYVFWQIIKQP